MGIKLEDEINSVFFFQGGITSLYINAEDMDDGEMVDLFLNVENVKILHTYLGDWLAKKANPDGDDLEEHF